MKGGRRYNSKKRVLIASLMLIILAAIFVATTNSKKDNDNIFNLNKNNVLFRNENPNFLVDFVKEETLSYIRFETTGSNNTPFEEKNLTIGQKIEESLKPFSIKKGITFSLKGLSQDETMREKAAELGADIQPLEQGTYSFALTETGRSILGDENEAISQKTIVSKDVADGIDIEYQIISGKGLKEEIVLNELPTFSSECKSGECKLPANVFHFDLVVDEGLILNRDIVSGSYYFTDSSDKYYAHFLPEYAKDKLGNKTNDVNVEIKETDIPNKYEIVVSLDANWLLSSERVFPVRIDPSIVHDTTSIFNSGIYEGTKIENGYGKITLKDGLNGSYISPAIDMGENPSIQNFNVKTYASDTGDGETPFSTANLLTQWNFNEFEGASAESNIGCTEKCNLSLKGFVDTSAKDRLADSGWTSIYSKWGDGALMFDGVDDQVVGNVPDLSRKTVYSVEVWLLPKDGNGYVFTSNFGSLILQDGFLKIVNGTNTYDTDLKIDLYKWQHIVVIFDSINPRVVVYNGADKFVVENYSFVSLSSDTLYVGGYPTRQSFAGVVDTLRFFDRAMTEMEIFSSTQLAYVGTQLRTSADSIEWGKWQNMSEKSIEINEPVTKISPDSNNSFVSANVESMADSRILSFLIAGDEKESNLKLRYVGESNETIDTSKPINYKGIWIKPGSDISSCKVGSNDESPMTVSFNDSNHVYIQIGEMNSELSLPYISGDWNYLSFSLEKALLNVYLNGFFTDQLPVEDSFKLSSESFSLDGCSSSTVIGETDMSNLSKVSRSIRSIYDSMLEAQQIKINFRAELQSSDLVHSSSDTVFSISETKYGSLSNIENLNIADIVIVKETIGDTTFMTQGEVKEVNNVTGKVLVKSWKEGSTFPEQGFSVNSKVFKWQRVYLEATQGLRALRGDLGGFNFSKDGVSKAEYLLKDFNFISPFEVGDDFNLGTTLGRYLQYQVIFVTKDKDIKPYITEVQIDYDSLGPTMEKVMRHGKWFDSGKKQAYWWAD